jgi:hypothetical protein
MQWLHGGIPRISTNYVVLPYLRAYRLDTAVPGKFAKPLYN